MALQIFIGCGLLVLSVLIEVCFIELTLRLLHRYKHEHPSKFEGDTISFYRYVKIMTAVTLWMLVALGIIIILWTLVFWGLKAFPDIETCFYFSIVAFTTLGFGDILLPEQWKLLSGFIAADGFVIFGLNTAIFMEAMARLRRLRPDEAIRPSSHD